MYTKVWYGSKSLSIGWESQYNIKWFIAHLVALIYGYHCRKRNGKRKEKGEGGRDGEKAVACCWNKEKEISVDPWPFQVIYYPLSRFDIWLRLRKSNKEAKGNQRGREGERGCLPLNKEKGSMTLSVLKAGRWLWVAGGNSVLRFTCYFIMGWINL